MSIKMVKGKWLITGVVLTGVFVLNSILSEDDSVLKINSEKTLRVASANIDFRNDAPELLVKHLADLKADVLVLLEWIPQHVPENSIPGMKTVLVQMGRKHGISINVSERFGGSVQAQVFYTKIEKNQACRLPMGLCRLKIGEQYYAILGVHIPPPHLVDCKEFTNATLQELADLVHNGKLKNDFLVAKAGDPVIILGDLNAHPLNSKIRNFRKVGLINAVGHSGRGLNPTWPARIPFFLNLHHVPFMPLFRIDHILVSENIQIQKAGSFSIPGSDHRGVISDIYY